jgi:HAD superfamily hydrolase (TIGR01509 family)
MQPNAVAGVLLDMDGTLVDSDAAVERAWRAWAAEYRVDPSEVLALAHGVSAGQTVRRLLPALTDAEAVRSVVLPLELQYDDLSDVVATPGARRLVEVVRRLGLPWAVVTSADPRLAAARLGAIGVSPPVLVTSDDVAAGKPDPSGYLLAAARLGVDPSRCLVVEDTDPGVAAGRAAGALVAALKNRPADIQLRGGAGGWRRSGPW